MSTKNAHFLKHLQIYCLLIPLAAAMLVLNPAGSLRADDKAAPLYTLEWELVRATAWPVELNADLTGNLTGNLIGKTPSPAASKTSAAPQPTSTQAAKSGNKEQLLLAVTFTPQDGYYIYGNASQEQGKPTRLGLWSLNRQSALPNAGQPSATAPGPVSALETAFYPPAQQKPDLLNPGSDSFIYDQPTSFLLTLPQTLSPALSSTLAPEELVLTFSGLLCSANNCTPLEDIIKIPATAFDSTVQLDKAALNARFPGLADFTPGKTMNPPRALRQLSGASTIAKPDSLSTAAPDAATAIEGAENTPDSLTSATTPAASYNLTPEYYRPGLEVNSISKAMLLGFLAGFILNFMPCVLPVISIKISGLLYYSGNDEHDTRVKSFRQHCLYFAAGIMTWFFALGLVLLQGGMVWGQLFQYPLLVMILTAVIFSLSLSLFGVFTLPVLDLKHSNTSRNPRLQAFSAGLLATLLATPCSGPLLGGVLGWSFQQSPFIVFVVLASVGLGMSSLYFVLAAWPQMVRRLPRPGAWMSNVAQCVAFILMGSALWLLSSIPANRLMDSLVLLLVIALACWLWGRLVTLNVSRLRRIVSASLILLLTVSAFWQWNKAAANEVHWQPFTQALFEENLGNKAMLITFTADWCPNCKALERAVLSLDKVAAIKKKYGLIAIKVDLTNPNPAGEALLKQLGSNSIPLLAIFKPGPNADTPLVIRDLFTASTLNSALRQALD